MSENNGSAGGIGFVGLLQITFIVLKLIGVISWRWLWVLSPVWISTLLCLLILFIIFIIVLLKH